MFHRVNGQLLNTVCFGTGPKTLFALGGWVGSWEVWQQPFELLTQQGWRCAGFDHRASGESPAPLESITPEALVDDVFGVMDALKLDRCVLAGESLGTVVALQAVLRDPSRFTGLVLTSGAPQVTDAVAPLIEGSKQDFEATVAMFVEACVPEADSEHLKRWGRDILRRSTGPMAARIFETYLEKPLPPPALKSLKLPTLVIHGTEDAIVPFKAGAYLAREIPGATFVKLEGVGHVPPVTRPHQLVEAICAWHSRIAP